MNLIITLFAIIVLLPGLVVWIFYKFAPKFLWVIPVAAMLIAGFLFLKDISSITSESTFIEKWKLYFHNDWSMGFYLIYLPIVGVSVVFSLVAYLIKHFGKKSLDETYHK